LKNGDNDIDGVDNNDVNRDDLLMEFFQHRSE
jgi:hypothetical protein